MYQTFQYTYTHDPSKSGVESRNAELNNLLPREGTLQDAIDVVKSHPGIEEIHLSDDRGFPKGSVSRDPTGIVWRLV